jgi:alkaline phosphatase D
MRHLFGVVLLLCSTAYAEEVETLTNIAFGSCCRQNKPQDHWTQIEKVKPDIFLLLGDAIYGDTRDMKVLKSKWDALGAEPGFMSLRASCPIEAVWDDHDYGENDAGGEYPRKKESQKIFLDFLNVPEDDPRRTREGIYTAKLFGPEDERVQILFLDTRYFRGPLVREKMVQEPGSGVSGHYEPTSDTSVPLLGEAQWKWLKEQFEVPATLRIIATSIQFVSNEHRWEKWGNMPHERQRMIDLIAETKARGVVFISGDRHRGELSRLTDGVPYPLYDLTSSALNNGMPQYRNEVNTSRYGSLHGANNFGTILIDWNAEDPMVRLQLRASETGKVAAQHAFPLSELSF